MILWLARHPSLILTLTAIPALLGCNPPARRAPAADLERRPLYAFTEADLDDYLNVRRHALPDLAERVVALARQNIGQPYEIYLLGEFPFELYDPDPLYCLAKSDCLTFCEHAYAMALARDWWSFLQILQRLRYRDGQVGMLTRNHYTIADWNRNNAFLFEDMTRKLGDGHAWTPLRQTCRRAGFFAKFGVGQNIPDEPVTDAYIPKSNLPEVLAELRNGDFVNVIRGNDKSQYCGHTGLIAIGPEGAPNFLHSARPAVREQPLLGYVTAGDSCLGVKILRLRPDAERIMRRVLKTSPHATKVNDASLTRALKRRRAAAPACARPLDLDWLRASRLQAYRLTYDAPTDPALQQTLDDIDERIRQRLDIGSEEHAVGVLDLASQKLALINPDEMFYAASVPKICILAAYLENNSEMIDAMPADVQLELGRMIKHSSNELAAKYGRIVTLEKLEKFIRSKHYRFYDEDRGGGLWIGKHYSKDSPRVGDPLHDHSHGATVRQCLRFYLMMEQGRLVSAAASQKMREIFASPELPHHDTKFVAGLRDRDVSLIRKSGTWQDWHLDTARIEHDGQAYLLVAMTHHAAGAEYLSSLAAEMHAYFSKRPGEQPARLLHARKGETTLTLRPRAHDLSQGL